MVKSKSREERELKKCFQTYFTNALYQFSYGSINNNINEEVKFLWDKMCKEIYTNINIVDLLNIDRSLVRNSNTWDINPEKNIIKVMWDHFLRFYLKGGKATLRSVNEYLQTTKGQDNKIAQIFYDELVKNTLDSDWDFCLALHPSLVNNKNIIELLDLFLKKKLNIIKDELIRSWNIRIFEYEQYINNIETQKQFLLKELNNSILLLTTLSISPTISNTRKQTTLNKIEELSLLIESLHNNIPIIFKCKSFDTLFLNVDKKEVGVYGIERELFKLYRVIFSFEDTYIINNTQMHSVFPSKMFAEIIDISLSLSEQVNEKLFSKTSLNQMLNPIRNIQLVQDSQDFPIAGLAYQLNDNIVILSELNPSKPVKRLTRFIEQLKMYCLKQEVPKLPSSINISKNMIIKMMEEKDWSMFESIFDTKDLPNKEMINLSNQLFYEIKFKDNLNNLKEFEKWCIDNKIEWFNTTETKEDIINLILELFRKNDYNYTSKDSLLKFSKKQLTSLFSELEIVFESSNLYIDYCQHLKNHVYSYSDYTKSFVMLLNNIISNYFKDLNMINKNNYGIIDKKNLISTFNEYEIDQLFKDMLHKFNYKIVE
jgi:hypothetical protein